MKLGQLIKYNKSILLQKSCRKCGREAGFRPLFIFQKDFAWSKCKCLQLFQLTIALEVLSLIFQKFLKTWFIWPNQFIYEAPTIQMSGFRAKHKTQHPLLKVPETWRAMLNKGNKVGAIIMYLSKAFDTLNHSLSKLKFYSFNKNALTFIQSYFTSRHQRTRVGNSLANGKRS